MPDSKRLQILKTLTTHLETITEYSLTGKVYRGRRKIGDETTKPCLVIFELPPDPQGYIEASSTVSKLPWEIGIQGFIDPDVNHPIDPAHNLMAAVKAKIAELMNDGGPVSPPPEYLLYGLTGGVTMDSGMTYSPDETTDCAFFALKVTFDVVEDFRDLYE